jgi:hypothetical protein
LCLLGVCDHALGRDYVLKILKAAPGKRAFDALDEQVGAEDAVLHRDE